MLIKNRYLTSLALPIILFVVLLPVSAFITFYQNDDWCYYITVKNFLSGNFTLHPYVGPTLYLQAFLGALFARIFGIAHLPVLTLFIACVSLYFFVLILREFFQINYRWSTVIGLFFFLNPLGVYALWGFMTEHYFVAFLMAALYFFLKFESTFERKYYFAYFILVFLGLLVRQTSLVLPLSVAVYFLLKKDIRHGLFNLLFFILLYFFYSKILPLTPRILEVPLQFQHLLKFDYAYTVVYGSLLVLTAYTLPLVLNALNFDLLSRPKHRIILFAVLCVGATVSLNYFFKPMSVSWGEFPYFENVVERTGFYPRGIHGTKYYFAGNFDLWKYWDIAAKVMLAALVSFLAIKFKKINNIFGIYVVVYLGVMVITETYYDRYIYTIVPVMILYLLSLTNHISKFVKPLLVGFVIFLAYLAYLFSADFILVNKYAWDKSSELVQQVGVAPEKIQATNAWKLTFRNIQRDYRYNFSYDSQEINNDYRDDYILREKHKIEFPLNAFMNPYIYLYERKAK